MALISWSLHTAIGTVAACGEAFTVNISIVYFIKLLPMQPGVLCQVQLNHSYYKSLMIINSTVLELTVGVALFPSPLYTFSRVVPNLT